jgi:hypothetical protein
VPAAGVKVGGDLAADEAGGASDEEGRRGHSEMSVLC